MRRVRMIVTLSGGGPDDRNWRDFPAGAELDVADWEAGDLIRIGLAVPAGGGAGDSAEPAPQAEAPAAVSEPGAGAAAVPAEPAEPEPVPEPAPVAPPEVSPVTEVSPVAEVPGEPPAEEAADPAVGEPPEEPPNPHDIKQRWIDYAVARGEPPEVARDMTKADLMSKYGGRL